MITIMPITAKALIQIIGALIVHDKCIGLQSEAQNTHSGGTL